MKAVGFTSKSDRFFIVKNLELAQIYKLNLTFDFKNTD